MYIINNVTDGVTYRLHDQRDQNLRLIEPQLTLALNRTGCLMFQIPSSHKYYGTIKRMKSSIQVLEDGVLIFDGRVVMEETDLYNTREITCEGSMSYLHDSLQRPFSITGNIRDFLAEMLKRHNEQVEERKILRLGRVNVVDENNELRRESAKLETSWNTLKEQLLDVHGGNLWVEYKEDGKYLNYTYDYGGINEQQIRFGVNLLDLTKRFHAMDVATCLIPYGAEVEYRDELGGKQTRLVDITSVNGGQDYITADPAVMEEFGKIWGTHQWADITDPERLLKKAKEYIQEVSRIPDSIKVSAIDLNYAGVDIRRFRVGHYVRVVSKPHGISKDLMLSELELYLDDPAKGTISLGTLIPTYTASVTQKHVAINQLIKETENKAFIEMNRKIENATSLITGGFGGYVVLDVEHPETGEKMHPWRILVMNTPDKNTAQNVIQINQNGLGFSTTGIHGPYRNAWTIDGNLVADFITTGTMLADRVRGGTLEVGGSGIGRDGQIVVKDVNNQVIGYWDKTGLHVYRGVLRGPEIIGGSIEIGDGLFYAGDDGVSLGDYYISSNGTNELVSSNGYVKIDCKDRPAGSPGLEYAALHLGGGGYGGVEILGTGQINCGGIRSETIECYDIKFPQSSWADGWSLLRMLEDLYDRVNNLENT